MPKESKKASVLVDTSFLITLYDNRKERVNHKVAKKYYKYFLDHEITMRLSTIVTSEYHQQASVIDIIASTNYIPLPFNVLDSLKVSDVAHALGSEARSGSGGRAEFKDDLKLIAQAIEHDIDYVITEDEGTLAKYCRRLHKVGILKAQVIVLSEGYDESTFNNGQASLLLPD